jgi:hypothetical protein
MNRTKSLPPYTPSWLALDQQYINLRSLRNDKYCHYAGCSVLLGLEVTCSLVYPDGTLMDTNCFRLPPPTPHLVLYTHL